MQKTLIPLVLSLLLFSCEQKPYQMGERLYKKQCANCHMDGGEGLGELIPPLKGSDYLATHREQLACMVRYGLKDTIVVNGKIYGEQMVSNDKMNDIQVANVVNYVLQSWGNNEKVLTFDEVEAELNACGK